jgi:hypothetical protein
VIKQRCDSQVFGFRLLPLSLRQIISFPEAHLLISETGPARPALPSERRTCMDEAAFELHPVSWKAFCAFPDVLL